LDDPFWIGVKTGIDAAAEEIKDNAEVIHQVCEADANVQNKQIQDMITSGVAGLNVIYHDMEAIKQSVKLANENNIPFVYCDRPVYSDDEITVDWGIASDNYTLTYNGWEWMIQYAKDNDLHLKVLELAGSLTDDNVLKRTDAFDDILKKYPDIVERVQTVPTEWNLEKALAGVTNALQASPDINTIFIHGDYLLSAVIQALESADRYKKIGEEGHMILMPYSGNETTIKAMKEGYVEMAFGMDVYKCGYESTMAAYNLALGLKEYGEPIADPGFILTQENFDEMVGRAYGAKVLEELEGE